MTASATTAAPQPVLSTGRPRPRRVLRTAAPAIVVAANGLAFFLVRPGVNDLWAARARASAVSHGVGLTYWFGWFAGGATPGNYSVLTPSLCAAIGTELAGALCAVVAAVLVTVLLRGTRHPELAAWAAALAIACNLWSGRVPFLFGTAIALAALLAVRRKARAATVGLTVLSVLATPVAGAFIALGLSGTFLSRRTREYRQVVAYAVLAAAVALVGVGLVFGTPGAEPFPVWMALSSLAALALIDLAKPPDHIRIALWVSAAVTIVLAAVPNGLGSNLTRFVWFCLPVAVLATARLRTRLAALAVAPALLVGLGITLVDLADATDPVSSTSYYTSLAAELDGTPDLSNYRVEVVDHGGHAGYDALLGHAALARGWETQEDVVLNKTVHQSTLDAVTYRDWLDSNAVAYVALPASSVGHSFEYTLVKRNRPSYLTRVWRDHDWQLFRVADPTPIVGRPARMVDYTQSTMTIRVPCACTVGLRVRWSKFLAATLQVRAPSGSGTVDRLPRVAAKVIDNGAGWTLVRTSRPGDYTLRGSLGGLLR